MTELQTENASPLALRQLEHDSGVLLIVASCAMVGFMAIHPQAHAHDTASLLQDIARQATFNTFVHGTLMGIISLVSLALWGFAQSRGLDRMTVRFGLVSFAVGTGSLIGAAAINGIVLSNLARHYAGSDAVTVESVRPLLSLCMEANHACDFIGVFGLSLALAAWSYSLWRDGARGLAVLGILAGIGAPTLLLLGKLPMSVHGFGAFVLAQTIWMVGVGYQMWRGTFTPPRN